MSSSKHLWNAFRRPCNTEIKNVMQQLEAHFFFPSTEKDSERCSKDPMVIVGLSLTKWYFIFDFLDYYNEFSNVW